MTLKEQIHQTKKVLDSLTLDAVYVPDSIEEKRNNIANITILTNQLMMMEWMQSQDDIDGGYG